MPLVSLIPRIKVDGIVYARDQVVAFDEERTAELAASGFGEIVAGASVWTEHAQRVASSPPEEGTPTVEALETLEEVAADQPANPPPPTLWQRLFG